MDFLKPVRTNTDELGNIKNLDCAPEFWKLVVTGHNILRYKDGRVTVETEMPPIKATSLVTVGVKP